MSSNVYSSRISPRIEHGITITYTFTFVFFKWIVIYYHYCRYYYKVYLYYHYCYYYYYWFINLIYIHCGNNMQWAFLYYVNPGKYWFIDIWRIKLLHDILCWNEYNINAWWYRNNNQSNQLENIFNIQGTRTAKIMPVLLW